MTQRRSGRTGDGIIRRGDTFSFRVYLPGGGREWYGGYKSHAEAAQDKKIKEAEKLTRSGRTRETCGEWADRWLEDYNVKDGKERWSDRTVAAYALDLKRFREDWGSVPLDKLMTAICPSMQTGSRRRVPGFDAWAIHQPRGAMTVLAACLEDARKSRLISENPLAGRKAPAGKGRRLIEAITEDELQLLGRCALEAWGEYGPYAQAYVIWQGTVGTRPIAVRHLRTEHVDLRKGEAYLAWPGKKVSPRTVLIPPQTVELLARLPRRLGAEWFFVGKSGKRFNKSSEFYMWQPIRQRFEAALPPDRARQLRDSREDGGPMDLYELRHCTATTLRRRGATWEEIASQLCHTDGGDQAKDTYSHLTETDHMASLRRLWGGNVTPISDASSDARRAI